MKTKRTRDPTWHSMMMLGKFAKLCSPVFSVEVRRDAVGRKQEHFALGQHPCPRVWLSLALISNDETRRPRYPLGHSQRGLGLLSGSMVGAESSVSQTGGGNWQSFIFLLPSLPKTLECEKCASDREEDNIPWEPKQTAEKVTHAWVPTFRRRWEPCLTYSVLCRSPSPGTCRLGLYEGPGVSGSSQPSTCENCPPHTHIWTFHSFLTKLNALPLNPSQEDGDNCRFQQQEEIKARNFCWFGERVPGLLICELWFI